MALFTNQRRPKGFTRKPVYWDPEKEEREAREKRIRAELGLDAEDNKDKYNTETYRPDIKGKFRSTTLGNLEELRQIRKKNIRRMFIFIFILIALLYLIMTALPFLELFLEKFAS